MSVHVLSAVETGVFWSWIPASVSWRAIVVVVVIEDVGNQ